MLAPFLTAAYLPFAIAFVVMIGIGLTEAIGLGLGHLDLDGDIGAEGHGGVLDWLGLGGELPILIWLTSLLGCFTIAGVAIQQISERLAERLIVTARANVFDVGWFALTIGNVARLRFFSADDIAGEGSGTATAEVGRARAILQNTLEQSMLAVPVHVALAMLVAS